MIPRPASFIALILLASCAHRTDGLPRCDGLHRRPANPNGSILIPPGDVPTPGAALDGTDSAQTDEPAGGCT